MNWINEAHLCMPVPLAVHTNMNVLNHHICDYFLEQPPEFNVNPADAPYPISAGHVPGGASLSLEVPLWGPPVTADRAGLREGNTFQVSS